MRYILRRLGFYLIASKDFGKGLAHLAAVSIFDTNKKQFLFFHFELLVY